MAICARCLETKQSQLGTAVGDLKNFCYHCYMVSSPFIQTSLVTNAAERLRGRMHDGAQEPRGRAWEDLPWPQLKGLGDQQEEKGKKQKVRSEWTGDFAGDF